MSVPLCDRLPHYCQRTTNRTGVERTAHSKRNSERGEERGRARENGRQRLRERRKSAAVLVEPTDRH